MCDVEIRGALDRFSFFVLRSLFVVVVFDIDSVSLVCIGQARAMRGCPLRGSRVLCMYSLRVGWGDFVCPRCCLAFTGLVLHSCVTP